MHNQPEMHTTTDACKGCGACVESCGKFVIAVTNGHATTIPERSGHCIFCGLCVAVCPNDALTHSSFNKADFPALSDPSLQFGQFQNLLMSRRSIRLFKDRSVERSKIDQILEATATAPMGFPPHTTEVLVIENAAERDILFDTLRKDYDWLVNSMKNPIARQFVRLSAGAIDYHSIQTHILEVVADANRRYKQDKSDCYTYHAPVVMLFHANKWEVAFRANAVIAATYAMLAAHALGLGTTLLEIVGPIVNRSKPLKQRWSLPEDNEVVLAMIVGYPKYKFHRGIKRQLKGVRVI